MYTNTVSLLALVGAAQAHMSIFYPAPLGGAPSINKQSTVIDKEFNFPLGCCGPDGGPSRPSPGVCRGHLDKFDTEEASVTWEAGQDAYFQLTDYSYDSNAPGGTHYGGSCQVGFSTDKGVTWKVAASYHGACPKHTEDGSPEAQTFDFKVPTGMPEGDALFAWVWLNREHESFMNCAKVKISGGSGSTTPSQPTTPSQSASQPETPIQSSTQPQQPDDNEKYTPPAAKTSSSSIAEPTESPEKDYEEHSHNHWWSHHPHKEVKAGSRKYHVDGWNCECRREILNSRCYCKSDDTSAEKRAAVEKKALRMHRRTLYKRVDACDWATAPTMEVSYFTEDAKCAPNAKQNTPESDNFELSWDVSCGVVESDGGYSLRQMDCGMYGA